MVDICENSACGNIYTKDVYVYEAGSKLLVETNKCCVYCALDSKAPDGYVKEISDPSYMD